MGKFFKIKRQIQSWIIYTWNDLKRKRPAYCLFSSKENNNIYLTFHVFIVFHVFIQYIHSFNFTLTSSASPNAAGIGLRWPCGSSIVHIVFKRSVLTTRWTRTERAFNCDDVSSTKRFESYTSPTKSCSSGYNSSPGYVFTAPSLVWLLIGNVSPVPSLCRSLANRCNASMSLTLLRRHSS